MKKTNWLINILILVSILTLSIVLCGSSGENTNCVLCPVCNSISGHTNCIGCGVPCTGEETTEHEEGCLYVSNPTCPTCNVEFRNHGLCSVCEGTFQAHTTCPDCFAECHGSNTVHQEGCPRIPTSDPESSDPESSDPGSSAPESSDPGSSAPESSDPGSSAPESSVPESSAPESSAPESSAPESSAPSGNSVPEEYESAPPYEGPTDVVVVDLEKDSPSTGSSLLVPLIITANVLAIAALALLLFRKKTADR